MDLSKLVEQAEVMQAQAKEVKKGLERKHVEGSSTGGGVKIKANAAGHIVGAVIDPEAIKSAEKDPDHFTALLVEAINDAQDKASKIAHERMSGVIPEILPQAK